MTWVMPVGSGERNCENSSDDNSSILGICVTNYGRIVSNDKDLMMATTGRNM